MVGSDYRVTVTGTPFTFADAATTAGQSEVAGVLGGLGTGTGDLTTVIGNLNTLSAAAAPLAFDMLGGRTVNAAMAAPVLAEGGLFAASLSQRLAARSAASGETEPGFTAGQLALAERGAIDMLPTPLSGGGLWAQSYGSFNPLGGGATAIATGSDDVAASGGGAIVGVDRELAPGVVAGVAAGYDRIRLGLDGLDQQGEIASHRLAVYGGRQVGGLRLGASAGYAYHRNRTERQISFAAIDRAAAAAYGGHELTLAGETGYRLELGDLAGAGVTAEPVAGLAYTRLIEAGYEESGAGAVDLTVDGRTTQSLRSTVGLRLGLDGTARVRPQASLAWGHEFATTERGANARFAGGGGSFTLEGEDAPRDLALATIGIEADLAPGTALSLGADGALGQDQTHGALKAAIKLSW